jgi:thymidine phosphorylase
VTNVHPLRVRRIGIDTYTEPVVFLRSDCPVSRSEGFEALSQVELRARGAPVVATLYLATDHRLALEEDEAGLSEATWRLLGAQEGETVTVSHPAPVESLGRVRAKLHGRRLGRADFDAIVRDVVAGRYADVHVACFLSACGAGGLSREEMVDLTRAMVDAGERIDWGTSPVVDKHCVGGLPGNRTTLVVVPIVAAAGLCIPKTSSRAITSPAGTADVMETLAPVDLDLAAVRRVVEREGACVAWGGAMRLSPADDVLIRVERPLEIDTGGQLVASILSKKAAAGSTHVVIDVPVGPTAKVRDAAAAAALGADLTEVGRAVGLVVDVVTTDGSQPVGRGIGPALEARDVLGVLRNEPDAPQDLRERALALAGRVIEFSPAVPRGSGAALARAILDDGRAWRKFQAVCEAQGGMRIPGVAPCTHAWTAPRAGTVAAIDNRRLARIAKLAGAPAARTAGVDLHVALGSAVEPGQPLFTLHAETPGEVAYALDYAQRNADVVEVAP